MGQVLGIIYRVIGTHLIKKASRLYFRYLRRLPDMMVSMLSLIVAPGWVFLMARTNLKSKVLAGQLLHDSHAFCCLEPPCRVLQCRRYPVSWEPFNHSFCAVPACRSAACRRDSPPAFQVAVECPMDVPGQAFTLLRLLVEQGKVVCVDELVQQCLLGLMAFIGNVATAIPALYHHRGFASATQGAKRTSLWRRSDECHVRSA